MVKIVHMISHGFSKSLLTQYVTCLFIFAVQFARKIESGNSIA